MKIWMILNLLFGQFLYPIVGGFNKKLIRGENVRFRGWAYIDIKHKSKIIIGDNVTINSSNYGYHINMYQRVKLLADGAMSEIVIGDNTRVHGSCIHAKSKITIGENCLIAANCHIVDSNGHRVSMDAPQDRLHETDEAKEIIIENNVWIAANCTILKGVCIGEGSVVAAGSVVAKSVPKGVVVRGNPAQIVEKIKLN